MSSAKQSLVLAILDFLNTSISDGSIRSDDKEGIEVAVQCIGEAFSVDPSNDEQREQLLPGRKVPLEQVWGVFTKTNQQQGSTSATSAPKSQEAAPEASPSTQAPSDEAKKEAEALKSEGNRLITAKQYDDAVEKYTQAIAKDPTNPVYYSNRAAAYSQLEKHQDAIDDAKKAAEVDPSFSKAYSRLGHALFCSSRYEEAVEAYEKGLGLDPTNASMKSSLQTARSRAANDSALNTSRDAGADAGAGGMPDFGAGGMPDLGSLMNNPQIMEMAQRMMADGSLNGLMNNPAMRGMAERFSSGGGMPNMQEMMNDPALRNIYQQFMGGGGAGGAGGETN